MMLHPHIHTSGTHPRLWCMTNVHASHVKLKWTAWSAKQLDNLKKIHVPIESHNLSFAFNSISPPSLNQTNFLPTTVTSSIQLWAFLTACMCVPVVVIVAFWKNSLGNRFRVDITANIDALRVYVDFRWGSMYRFCVQHKGCQCRERGRS